MFTAYCFIKQMEVGIEFAVTLNYGRSGRKVISLWSFMNSIELSESVGIGFKEKI